MIDVSTLSSALDNPASGISYSSEIIMVIFLLVIFALFVKIFASFKVKGKAYKIPAALLIIFIGMMAGIAMTFIVGHPIALQVVPVFSMGTLIVLFCIMGAMMDFKQMKKIGIWFILLGTIPLIVEAIVIGGVITLVTKLPYYASFTVAALVAGSSIGVVATRLIQNITAGYEVESQTGQITSLASTLENITIVPMIIIGLIMFKIDTSGADMNVGAIVPLAVVILLGLAIVISIVFGLFIMFVIKPISRMIASPYKMDETGLVGEELEKAKELNAKSEQKSNKMFGILAVLFLIIMTVVMEKGNAWLHIPAIPLLTSGGGILLMTASLFIGFIVSYFGGKSSANQKAQLTFAGIGNKYYMVLGALIVWGFGGFVANPMSIFSMGGVNGSTQAVVDNITNGVWLDGGAVQGSLNGLTPDAFTSSLWAKSPHLIWLVVFLVATLLVRFICIFAVMSLSSLNTKQQSYMSAVATVKGTMAINNGASLLMVFGVPALVIGGADPTNASEAYTIATGYYLQEVMMAGGVFYIFVTVILGEIAMAYAENIWIFKWGDSVTDSTYKKELGNAIKEESVKSEVAKETKLASSNYWKAFFTKAKADKKLASDHKKGLASVTAKNDVAQQKDLKAKKNLSGKIRDIEILIQEATAKRTASATVEGSKDKFSAKIDKLNIKLADAKTKYAEVTKETEKAAKLALSNLEKKQKEIDGAVLPTYMVEATKNLSDAHKALEADISKTFKSETIKEITSKLVS